MRLTIILLAAISAAGAAPLSSLERQRLIAHFEMTTSWLASEVAGLSRAQLEFKPAPDSWSILEVVDHLLLSEPIYWQDFQKAMQEPPTAARRLDHDDDSLWYGIDRTHRGKAIAGEGTTGRLGQANASQSGRISLSQFLDDLRRLRAEILEYVKTTGDDLRSHLVRREGCDAYQWLVLVSAHSQRHILQIREIKADPKFPRK